MNKHVKTFFSLLLSVILAAALVIPSFAANTPGKIDYVAFGDSNAAGVRGGVGEPGCELSSDKGYTDNIAALLQLAGVLGSFDESFCTSGMTADLLAQNTAVLTDPASDEAQLVADAEIVTLDIGANDLLGPLYEYVGTLESVNDVDPAAATAVLTAMVEDLYTGTGAADIQDNIETILQNILTANGSAKIFVMGYYNPLPTLSAMFGVDMNEPTEYFNTFIQAAVSNVSEANPDAFLSYVDTFDAMAASSASLVMTDIHPTETGYQIIAGEFWKQIEPLISVLVPETPSTPDVPVLPAEAQAVPSSMPIIVGGLTLPFEAYLINDNNYVKLRDVAMALNGTPKQVAVGWDSDTKSVTVTSGEPYIPVGGELTPSADMAPATAILSPCLFYFDGIPLSLTAYMINDNNYIKLRDLAMAFDFAVDYDETTGNVVVDVTKGYTPPAE